MFLFVLFLLAIVLSNTAYPSRASEFTSCFRDVRFAQSLVFYVVFLWIVVFVLVLFLLAIVLSNTAYPSKASEFTSCFRGVLRVTQSLVFYDVFCRSLFFLLSFFCWLLYCLILLTFPEHLSSPPVLEGLVLLNL